MDPKKVAPPQDEGFPCGIMTLTSDELRGASRIRQMLADLAWHMELHTEWNDDTLTVHINTRESSTQANYLLVAFDNYLRGKRGSREIPVRVAPTDPPPQSGFPRLWQLFPFLLPRSVRERIYEPAHEELKEDYLRARSLCGGRWSRRWITFCFTMRTAGLFGRSIWAALGGAVRKAAVACVAFVFGEPAVAWLREKIAAWWGRLP